MAGVRKSMKEHQERYHNYIGRKLREEDAKLAEQSEDRIAALEKKVAKIEQFIKSIEN